MTRWSEDSEYLRNVDTDIALPKSKSQLESEEANESGTMEFRLRTLEKDELIGFVALFSIEWNNRAGF
ncbi:hypothetical protein E4665_03395 [Sporolactobacillus shoreae]|uniref:N-acetyltransferase n=1 Tax=Sporolactobacillus shoreae TaxID=1465501 RepID=A0A4Z0GQK5_9BACL|nr:hypothetical protein [Sporolactobacillus shoreae]TGA99389.1 hypothetical protein E4665_03395 [Sporolactobacillus shoreae]